MVTELIFKDLVGQMVISSTAEHGVSNSIVSGPENVLLYFQSNTVSEIMPLFYKQQMLCLV